MKLQLSSPITDVPRVGPTKAKYFQKLGVRHIRDLLFHFPRRYDDFSRVTPIAELEVGKQMTVRGRVKSIQSKWGFRGRHRLLRIFVEIEDNTGVLHVTWFNLRFLERQLPIGRELYVAGKVEPYVRKWKKEDGKNKHKSVAFSMRSPAMEFVTQSGEQTHTARITPVYPETYGVSSRFIRYQVKSLLPLIRSIPEYLPGEIIERNNLVSIHTALRAAHFPKSSEELEATQKRLRFDELFFLQLAALVRRQTLRQELAVRIAVTSSKVREYISRFPFSLTGAQQHALDEILSDIGRQYPMNRLLQGDVGSGKSAVALVAAQAVLHAGYKVLYLAPTEILARQQAKVCAAYLGGATTELLIGARTGKEKEVIKERIRSGGPVCVVGTHALLQDDVMPEHVGLVIVDEQHRFGVKQRAALLRRSASQMTPHLLSMTATPIPRTLNLTVYGDLDISVLDKMPPGRKRIKTAVVSPSNQEDAIVHVLEELHAGRQAYVIAPLVDPTSPKGLRGARESDWDDVKSAKEAYIEMKQLLPGVAVGLVHGRMGPEEKEAVMRNFAAGAIQLLVSTAVVEVGVDVPNATVMIIEGAERFGLAQLHQFRGRVGRAEHQSYCYLFPTTEEEMQNERLQALVRTNDGFVIAEEDLRLRGPGEVYGVAQSGFGDLKVASLLDYRTIKLARTEAECILKKDPGLKDYPILQAKVRQKNLVAHFE